MIQQRIRVISYVRPGAEAKRRVGGRAWHAAATTGPAARANKEDITPREDYCDGWRSE